MIIKNTNTEPNNENTQTAAPNPTPENENLEPEKVEPNKVKFKEKKSLKEIWNSLGFAKPFIIVGAIVGLLFAFVGGLKVYNAIYSMIRSTSPVVCIEATNDKIYPLGKQIKPKDFTITAICENNYKYKIQDSNKTPIEISQDTVNKIGDVTVITVRAKINGKTYTCKSEVHAQREEVISWECGFPYKEDVKAVLYNNGELAFEGNGDIVSYQNGYPWIKYTNDEECECPIKSVTFQETVTPQSLDYYFEGMTTLEYCGRIPSSTMSMIGTFKDCTALENGANWTQCAKLTDISYCYQGCWNITYVPAIPQYVKVADYCFLDCSFLTIAPDMQYAVSIESAMGMFKNCTRLNDILSLPIRLGYAKEMFMGCINLQIMPEIPENIVTMSNMFNGCKRLKKLTNIPASCVNVKYCFANCTFIEGDLKIDANPEYFECFLDQACTSTVINLIGSSNMLDILANTATTDTFDCVLVDGKKPNKNLIEREQIYDENGNLIIQADTSEEGTEEGTEGDEELNEDPNINPNDSDERITG